MIPLTELPLHIRHVEEARAQDDYELSLAWGNCKSRREALALYFHEDNRTGIQAALIKADQDPVIAELSKLSLDLRRRRDRYDRILRHLNNELSVRLAPQTAHRHGPDTG